MSNNSANPTSSDSRHGWLYLGSGLGLAVLGVALVVAQYSLKKLIVPWYSPALATLGFVLLILAIRRRRSWVRIAALGLVAVFAALQWFFLGMLMKLPGYDGPASAGQPMPEFRTALADGRPFTQQDLKDGRPSVLVFFRGRW